MPRLTKKAVDALSCQGDAPEVTWDDDIAGFGIRVFPSGTKKFVLKYRTRGGRQRWMGLGAFGPLTVERARELAKIELAKVIEGEDPAGQRQDARIAVTVGQLCDIYVEEAEKGLIAGRGGTPKKASTIATDKSRIAAQIKPLIGSMKAVEVTRPDIEALKKQIAEGKAKRDVRTRRRGRSIVRGGRGAATRVIGLLGAIFSWAADNGFVETNPVRGVRRFAAKQSKALLSSEQYQFLGSALDALQAKTNRHNEPAHNHIGIEAIRFIASSGVRRGEAEQLRWTEVDKAGTCLALQATKTGPSLRPLGRTAALILDRLDHEGEFAFPTAAGEAGYSGLPQLWKTVKREAARQANEAAKRSGTTEALPGPLEGLTIHSLRHSFAGTAESLGASVPTIAVLLGHRLGGVTGGYILRRPDRPLLDIADRVSEHIARAMRGEQLSAEILRFEARA